MSCDYKNYEEPNTRQLCTVYYNTGSQPVGRDPPIGVTYEYLHYNSEQKQNCSYEVAIKTVLTVLWLGTTTT